MYVSRIGFRDIRSFSALNIHPSAGTQSSSFESPAPHTVIIGENGTGKTTLLRAIAIGLADHGDASGLLAETTGQFVTEGKPGATIEIDLQPGDAEENAVTLKTEIKGDNGQDVLDSKYPEPFTRIPLVCGYGVSRANHGGETGRSYRVVDSTHNLFQYQTELIQTELALRRLRDFLGTKWYPRMMKNIKKALGLESDVKITLPKGGGVRISGTKIGRDIPLEGWADGYKQTLAWILDFYAWAMKAGCITDAGDVTGIVLIDEIEQHLHASMQIKLLSRLRGLLPHVQVIATTHSPLVALGVSPEELIVLKREGGEVRAHESVTDFHAYSVEDMLTDPKLFASEVYHVDITEKLARYRLIAGKPIAKRSAKEREDLKQLGIELAEQQIPEARENPVLMELQRILDKHKL